MSVNKVILIGNVGRDPEVRYLDSGIAVASLPLATTDRAYTLANGTQVPERTEWHNLVLWRGLAETAEKYVHKGDKLYVEGKIRTRSYDDQTGAKRYVTEIFVDSMEMLSPRGTAAPGAAAPQAGVSQGAPAQPMAQSQATPAQDNTTDDLPF
ncbi:single-stranded DNA-binding protein [uncultured Bacteroides sp.]|jgi:single-strand binding protein|uniref:single-stranded DNA-binding protein n=1 Tax=uncultured Bacteroides sp. TaxID=162156 RepID=UPI00263A0BAB|nr:single-stranded DNA-binding protein [uncultured Bacteroides sp.]